MHNNAYKCKFSNIFEREWGVEAGKAVSYVSGQKTAGRRKFFPVPLI